MKIGKSGVALLALAGVVLLTGCGKKEEEAAPPAAGGTASGPPANVRQQIMNNPQIPADQKAKYSGGGAPTGR